MFQCHPGSQGSVPDPLPAALQGLLAAKAADMCSVGARSALNKMSLGAGDWHSWSLLRHCLDYHDCAWAGGCVPFLGIVKLLFLLGLQVWIQPSPVALLHVIRVPGPYHMAV